MIDTPSRDAFVLMLKTLIAGWRCRLAHEIGCSPHETAELETLIAKTETFLREEFGQ